MKKNSGRRKAPNQRRKAGKRQAPTRPMQAKAPDAEHSRHRGNARRAAPNSGRHPLHAGLRRIDWAAVAILVLPLIVMALLDGGKHGIYRDAGGHAPAGNVSVRVPPETPSPPHGDVVREAKTFPAEPADHAAVASPVAPIPKRDDLADAVAAEPAEEPAQPTALASIEAPPAPRHKDLTLEATPLLPEQAQHAARLSVIGHAAAAAMPEPICLPDGAPAARERTPSSVHPAAFGRALAQAARAQTEDFVIYNARYVTLSYPRGDTPPLYGVCTDVVVRAYRSLGIDLQELIHTSRLGRGDHSIDHRRVEIVARFLTHHGTRLEISEFAEDYRPGDIVTYHRPEGRVSQHHIAIVSDLTGPSGRPLIVHNRGWGPQVEDALFVDRMTGHYRFTPGQAEAYASARPPRAAGLKRPAVLSIAARR